MEDVDVFCDKDVGEVDVGLVLLYVCKGGGDEEVWDVPGEDEGGMDVPDDEVDEGRDILEDEEDDREDVGKDTVDEEVDEERDILDDEEIKDGE